jgi:hypothetical protein
MKPTLFILPVLLFFSCGQLAETAEGSESSDSIPALSTESYLVCLYTQNEEPYFLNEKGIEIIPVGKYVASYTDTIRAYGMVMDSTGRIWAITQADSAIFEVYNFDNGPDYIEEGLFRIVKDGLIGFANEAGEIVIAPHYQCAYPFEDGTARVAFDCESTIEFEMTKWESEKWFFINHSGAIVPE